MPGVVDQAAAPLLGNLNAKESQIVLTRPGTPTKNETWPELDVWMANALEAMHKLFSPMVKGPHTRRRRWQRW